MKHPASPSAITSRLLRDRHLDAVCRTATALLQAPIASVSVLDETTQWFAGREGLTKSHTPRDHALCAWTLQTAGQPLIILDAASDPRFEAHPAVTGALKLRFYAGIPLSVEAGRYSASFCIADTRPWSTFSAEQTRTLHDLALFVEAHLKLMAAQDQGASEAETLRLTLDSMDQGIVVTDAESNIRVHNRQAADLLGVPEEILTDGRSIQGLRDLQIARGEFNGLPADLRRWLELNEPDRRPPCYERDLPNGKTVEVRTVPARNGGLVRTFSDVTARRAAESALRDSERRYRLIAENAHDIVTLSDLDLQRRYFSPAVKPILGYEPAALLQGSAFDLTHPEDAEAYRRVVMDVRDGRLDHALTTQRYRHRDGHYVWLEVSIGRTVDPVTRRADGIVATMRDITARKVADEALRASEARLRVSEERLAMALDSGDDGLFDIDLENGATWYSPRWIEKLGYDIGVADLSPRFLFDAVHPEDQDRVLADVQAHFDGRTPSIESEHRLRRMDGSYIWVLSRARVTRRAPEGRALRVVGTLIDISQRKQAEMRITHMAEHDALTDLPNRYRFRQHLQRALESHTRALPRHAVLVCDLDRFKAVNDTMGHLTGDQLLCAAGERLRTAVRPDDVVARLGGDEFAVILGDADDEAAMRSACDRIIAAFAEPVPLNGDAVSIGISIGVARMTAEDTSPEEVFKRADIALYQAKAAGRNTYCLYDAENHARVAALGLLALDMREAMRRGDFFMVYQPLVDMISGEVTSFEALMRWRHPERGLISPSEFIPIAEETGMIVSLGSWALAEACQVAATWPQSVHVAVNVSAVQFRGGLEEAVAEALQGAGLDPSRLKLEVTETALMHDPERAVAVLNRLRSSGVRVALDDFGTGYSSLTYLRRFPFDRIKIDRSFVSDIADPDAAAIIRAVVGIGARLGMGIVAEGVETAEQLDLLRREGCAEGQGYLFSKPMRAEEVQGFLASARPLVAA